MITVCFIWFAPVVLKVAAGLVAAALVGGAVAVIYIKYLEIKSLSEKAYEQKMHVRSILAEVSMDIKTRLDNGDHAICSLTHIAGTIHYFV